MSEVFNIHILEETNKVKLPTYNTSAEPFLSVIVQLMIGISIRNSDSGVRVYRVTLSGGGGRLPPLLLMVVELAMLNANANANRC